MADLSRLRSLSAELPCEYFEAPDWCKTMYHGPYDLGLWCAVCVVRSALDVEIAQLEEQNKEDLARNRTGEATPVRPVHAESATSGVPDLHAPDFWRCKTCGCLWRDNHDEGQHLGTTIEGGSVSLASAKQTSCLDCEMKPVAVSCEPLYRFVHTAKRDQECDFHEDAVRCDTHDRDCEAVRGEGWQGYICPHSNVVLWKAPCANTVKK